MLKVNWLTDGLAKQNGGILYKVGMMTFNTMKISTVAVLTSKFINMNKSINL